MNVMTIGFKNLKRKRIRSALTIGGVSIAVAVLVSLFGFDRGYQESLTANIDKMGYQLLITAKGCPYEAATMMLKGGGGLRYMEEDIYADMHPILRQAGRWQILAHLLKMEADGQVEIVSGEGTEAVYRSLIGALPF